MSYAVFVWMDSRHGIWAFSIVLYPSNEKRSQRMYVPAKIEEFGTKDIPPAESGDTAVLNLQFPFLRALSDFPINAIWRDTNQRDLHYL